MEAAVPSQEAWTVTIRSPPSWVATSIRADVVAIIIPAQAYKMMVNVIIPVHTCGSWRPSASLSWCARTEAGPRSRTARDISDVGRGGAQVRPQLAATLLAVPAGHVLGQEINLQDVPFATKRVRQ